MNRKGLLQGGWIDQRGAKLALQREVANIRDQLNKKEEEHKKNREIVRKGCQENIVSELRRGIQG